ncbi:hypothetical protein ACWEPR_36780 [Streptomyces sp. NPDC004290]
MTIRVYQVGADGVITQDRGTVASIPYAKWPVPQAQGYPPCACPYHRAVAKAVTR